MIFVSNFWNIKKRKKSERRIRNLNSIVNKVESYINPVDVVLEFEDPWVHPRDREGLTIDFDNVDRLYSKLISLKYNENAEGYPMKIYCPLYSYLCCLQKNYNVRWILFL